MAKQEFRKNNRSNQNYSNIDYGRLPPHAEDMEEAIIGCCMITADKNVRFAISLLEPADFFVTKHQIIFAAIKEMSSISMDIDLMTVVNQLKKTGKLDEIGGPYGLALFTQKVSSSAYTPTHAKLVKQKSLQRQLIALCAETTDAAFDDVDDVIKVIDNCMLQLTKLNDSLDNPDASVTAQQVSKMFLKDVNSDEEVSRYVWKTGDPQFDEIVGLARDKIILVAGAAKHGKTKYVMAKMFYILDHYDDVAIFWVSLEDSAQYTLANYLSTKIFVKPKHIMRRQYTDESREAIAKHIDKFNSFDIEFKEQSAKSSRIRNEFKNFCKMREGKFCILIVDNILALSDREDFKGQENSMYDYVMNQMLNIKQDTKALVIPIHHYKDSQQEESRIKSAFRPRLMDMKGTEAFRRIPNSVLLINNVGKFDELMNEYGEQREDLRHLYIVDTGANREDRSDDDTALIRYVHSLDYNIFINI